MDKLKLSLILLVLSQVTYIESETATQQYVDSLAQDLKIHWRVVSNTRVWATNDVELTITNGGTHTLTNDTNWGIYFDTPMMVEPSSLPEKAAILEGQGIKLRHWKGVHYIISATSEFIALKPGKHRKIKFHLSSWTISRTDTFPNWYIHIDGFSPKTITNTIGQSLDFVAPLNTPSQWKRATTDRINPFTPQERYRRNMNPEVTSTQHRIIPKPDYISTSDAAMVTIDSTWQIVAPAELTNEANYLKDILKINIVTSAPTEKFIQLQIGNVMRETSNTPSSNNEAYRLKVTTVSDKKVELTGKSSTGVFYGIQTLWALMSKDKKLPEATVVDEPRFEYRGMHIDVARNFHSKAAILKLLGVMSMYKLNKLHFHLSDDEGWRLEINGLPELTQLGARRCFTPDCLLPQYGSGPDDSTSGSGYYTTADYQEILRYAAARHIQVIPEFDMPGHARAAIKAMEYRYNNIMNSTGNRQNAEEYYLTEPGDTSKYWSVQYFDDNAVNPCLNSTYTFLSKVLDAVISLHANIQPLKLYNYGGDEVGKGAWVNSTKCKELINGAFTSDDVKEIFFRRVTELTGTKDLDLAAWEDGVMEGDKPFNLSMSKKHIYAYSWNNIWEWGGAGHAYNLANSGYKVVMSQATHLYFDHPHEPDPEERGYYWAPRFTNAKKTFGFMPVNVYQNIDFTRFGEPLTKAAACGADNKLCPDLSKPENIVGMQGHLWSETVRTDEQLDYMIYPRLLAVAERAWHKATWESFTNKELRDQLINADWAEFSKAVGERELERLDDMGIAYRVSPPGGRVDNGKLKINTEYSGQTVLYSMDNGVTWLVTTDNVVAQGDNPVLLKSRNKDGTRESRVVTLQPMEPLLTVDQSVIDYIANSLSIEYEVLDNFDNGLHTYLAAYTLKNVGGTSIPLGNWVIYFYSIYMVEPTHLKGDVEYELPGYNVILQHVNGGLFKLRPARGFGDMMQGETRKFQIRVRYWSVAKSDVMPNIFVTADGMDARTIKSTSGESLSFVHDFVRMNQWKRYNEATFKDRFDPFTPNNRYTINDLVKDLGRAPIPVLPTPLEHTIESGKSLSLAEPGWKIVTEASLMNEATFLKDEMSSHGLPTPQITAIKPSNRFIHLNIEDPRVMVKSKMINSPEAYSLNIEPGSQSILIKALDPVGIFYGVQSLLSFIRKSESEIPKALIKDAPRFHYRGMHLDVGRNFHSNVSVLRLLDAMAMYKLNKFHFHLTDDEGWRLEIPGLEELTKIGSNRCSDMTERTCIIPQLGSGPDTTTSGSGFYTVEDYKEILEYAAKRHIEVIPEFDMPGHAHAAIKSMEARAERLRDVGDDEGAMKYQLHDRNDSSKYTSVQLFHDNSINPCLDSTYVFVKHIAEQVKMMHKDINPLKVFHFGGDEVAEGAWVNSTLCKKLGLGSLGLKKLFTTTISNMTHNLGLNLGGWEDGLKEEGNTPFPRNSLVNNEVYGYAWSNVWEWGAAARGYIWANAGYKVVMAPATNYYFDHPYEPDPEERGFYWATRYTPTKNVYSFMPLNLYENAELKVSGDPITTDDFCGENNENCPELTKTENVVGVQGHLWSETVRTAEQLDYMIFPRLLALAERGWHEASWESLDNKEARNKARDVDWEAFSNSMGYGELKQLDAKNIKYRVPPPGAKIHNNKLHANSEIPGLKVSVSQDGGKTWTTIGSEGMDVNNGANIRLVTMSADQQRKSREISLTVGGIVTSSAPPSNIPMSFSAIILLMSHITLFHFISC